MADSQGGGEGTALGKKPAVLIVGGLGYIGRFLALHIHSNNLASEIRIVDKVLPQLAWLAPEFKEACSQERFLQADASRERGNPTTTVDGHDVNHTSVESMSRIFDRPNTTAPFDYVFNCGGETRYSQPDEVYKLRSFALSVNLAREAARRNIPAFVECSTGMVYKPDRNPRKESDKTKPWLKLAKWRLDAEAELSKIPGLNLCVLRIADVYGDYDSGIISKALCLARVYKELGKEMSWLWTKELRINTVHVKDVARALFAAAEWRAGHSNVPRPSSSSAPSSPSSRRGSNADSFAATSPTFNIVDHGNTSQGTLADIIRDVFSIKTGFQGQLISQFARMNLDHVVDDLNEEILQPWADMLQRKGISRPGPLSPFLERELLKDTDLSLDGGLFERVVGFRYQYGQFSEAGVRSMVESYERMNWWP